jgi:hypothetical protein
MRAKEFTINVPINIKINGDGDPEIDMPSQAEPETPELLQNPVMVSPLQQELELAKAAQGKDTHVIDKITQDDDVGQEPAEEPDQDREVDDELLNRIKALISR